MSPRQITAFPRGEMQWARVPRIGATAVQRSLGVTDDIEAKEVCRFLEWLRGRGARSAYLLDAMATGRIRVLDAYLQYVNNNLDAYEQALRGAIADPDLEPYVAKWLKDLGRRQKPNADTRAKYERQVRTLLEKDVRFPKSQFTALRVSEWLGDLDVGQPNRYRAALSSFGQYLVFAQVLAFNPVLAVPIGKERDPRSTHLLPAEAKRLVTALEAPYRAMHALMICTGMELGAVLRTLRSDVKDAEVHARGTKRHSRERECAIYDRWRDLYEREVLPYVEASGALPYAKLFPDIKPWWPYRALKAALKLPALQDLPRDYTEHDHRHTWAVQAVRDRIALPVIAHQLGHRDGTMVLKVYGKFIPTAQDFTRNATDSATEPTRLRRVE